jgi:hypothetical protein
MLNQVYKNKGIDVLKMCFLFVIDGGVNQLECLSLPSSFYAKLIIAGNTN